MLVFLIGARLFSRATGLAAGVGAALYWILIYFDNELLIPVLFVFLILACFYMLIRALGDHPLVYTPGCAEAPPQSPRSLTSMASSSAIAGAFFGLAAITRPSVLIFLPALVWIFLRGVKRSFPLRAVLVFALAALIPIGAVTAYNTIVGGDFVIIASQGGVNFYIGNNAQSDGQTAIVPGTQPDWWGGRFDTIKIAEREEGRALKDSEVSSFWLRKALHFIARHPWQWLKLTARKVVLFASAAEIGNNSPIYYLRSYAPIMKLPFLGFGLIAPLGIAGIWLVLRRRRQQALLPLFFIILYSAGVVAFFVCARYRAPVIPFLLIFAGYAVTKSAGLLRQRAWRSLLPVAAIIGAAAIAVNADLLSQPENIALAKFHDGVALQAKGRVAEAEAAFREALRLNPGFTVAQRSLAGLLADQGSPEVAIRAYERMLAMDPANVRVWSNLAGLQADAGNLAAAESTVTRALEIDPDFSDALLILGAVRERRGDLTGAREAYLHALQYTRRRHRLEGMLGVLSAKEGKYGEAEERMRCAVELDPAYANGWFCLGLLLITTGRLDEAVEPLEQATALKPDSQEQWLKLADVLRRLGREAEAHRALRHATAAARSNRPVTRD